MSIKKDIVYKYQPNSNKGTLDMIKDIHTLSLQILIRPRQNYPHQIMGYMLTHDSFGGLSQVTTPLGYIHSFYAVPLIGMNMIKYSPPWAKDKKFIYCLDFNGDIIHKVGPSRTNNYEPYIEQLINDENEEKSINEYSLFDIEHTGLATLIKNTV